MSAVNFGYLEGFLQGDRAVIVEVLQLFQQQGETWRVRLRAPEAEWRGLAHAIKGAARGVGAERLGDACERAEFGEPADLPAVGFELEAALAAIAAYLDRTRG